MTRDDAELYLGSRATFRRETAERSRPGSSAIIKNWLYAYALEKVIEYVAQLPDNDPRLLSLEAVDFDRLAFGGDNELHAHTIHCSLGKPPKTSEWFSDWVRRVIASANEIEDGGDE